jgi:filamentous hemagglutinin
VVVRRSQYPEAAAHIEHAQRHGQPTVLTLDRAGAAQRRRESLRYTPRKESSPRGNDRDEYPPAMTTEGGFNANVRYIGARDNRGAGTHIEHRVRDLPDGERIRVLVTD